MQSQTVNDLHGSPAGAKEVCANASIGESGQSTDVFDQRRCAGILLFQEFRLGAHESVGYRAHCVGPILGAPDLKLFYRYESIEGSAKGSDSIPFQSRPHAEYYAESFPDNLPRIIRMNLKSPQKTHFFERDQKG